MAFDGEEWQQSAQHSLLPTTTACVTRATRRGEKKAHKWSHSNGDEHTMLVKIDFNRHITAYRNAGISISMQCKATRMRTRANTKPAMIMAWEELKEEWQRRRRRYLKGLVGWVDPHSWWIMHKIRSIERDTNSCCHPHLQPVLVIHLSNVRSNSTHHPLSLFITCGAKKCHRTHWEPSRALISLMHSTIPVATSQRMSLLPSDILLKSYPLRLFHFTPQQSNLSRAIHFISMQHHTTQWSV